MDRQTMMKTTLCSMVVFISNFETQQEADIVLSTSLWSPRHVKNFIFRFLQTRIFSNVKKIKIAFGIFEVRVLFRAIRVINMVWHNNTRSYQKVWRIVLLFLCYCCIICIIIAASLHKMNYISCLHWNITFLLLMLNDHIV